MKYHAPYGVTDPNAPYINGDPSIGQAGSIPPAQSIEFPQREITNLISKGGLVPDDADLMQLTRGVRRAKFAFGIDTGSQNRPSITLDPPLLSYEQGTEIRVLMLFTNSTAATIRINGLPAVPIIHSDGLQLVAGDLIAGGIAVLIYDGIQSFQLVNSKTGSVSVSGNTGLPYVVDSGTPNHILGTFSPAIASLYAGLAVLVKLSNNVTGATDFSPNSLAVKPVKWPNGTALVAGDAVTGGVMLLCYDGGTWQLLNYITHPGAGGTNTMDPGDIIMWPQETPKPGTFECNGQPVSRTVNANLFNVIGTTHGSGDGSTTFNVPDYRGWFLRGWSHGSGTDPDAGTRGNRGDGVTGDHVGTWQGDAFKTHYHTLGAAVGYLNTAGGSGVINWTNVEWANGGQPGGLAVSGPGSITWGSQEAGNPVGVWAGYIPTAGITVSVTLYGYVTIAGNTDWATGGSTEDRPKNKNIMFCIAY